MCCSGLQKQKKKRNNQTKNKEEQKHLGDSLSFQRFAVLAGYGTRGRNCGGESTVGESQPSSKRSNDAPVDGQDRKEVGNCSAELTDEQHPRSLHTNEGVPLARICSRESRT